MLYRSDMTAGGLKVRESRLIADLLLAGASDLHWRQALFANNILQARSLVTAKRLGNLIRRRLLLVQPPLWQLIRDGSLVVATQACFVATLKASRLLADFLDLVVREQIRMFQQTLSLAVWADFLDACRGREPDMPQWSDSTMRRLRSSIYSCLAEIGYLDSTKTRRFQVVHLAQPVLTYLTDHNERDLLRCLEVRP